MARIILIDDDEIFRTTLCLTLGEMGHVVIEASNGAVGLKLFRSAPADLVITDIVMPEKEGLEVMMTLRKEQPSAKIIVMSGDQGRLRAADNLHIAKRLGAAEVLEKPFTREALMSAINAALTSCRPLARPASVSPAAA